MNIEVVKSGIRWLITSFGMLAAGWFAAKGWFTVDQVTTVLSSETFLSVSASVIVGIWGLFAHTQKNAVAVVDALAKDPTSPVKAVIIAPTPEGKALADAMPGNTTVIAGTPAAAAAVSQPFAPK